MTSPGYFGSNNISGFDPHGKDWGTAVFLSAFGGVLPPERVKEIIAEASAKESAEPAKSET